VIRVEYTLGPKDWTEFSYLSRRRSAGKPSVRRKAWIRRCLDALLAGSAVGIGLWLVDLKYPLETQVLLLAIGAFALFYTLGVLVGFRAGNAKPSTPIDPNGALIGRRIATFDTDWLEVEAKNAAMRIGWQAFDEVAVHDRVVVLWLEPAVGIVLPRSAFRTKVELDQAIAYARERIGGVPLIPVKSEPAAVPTQARLIEKPSA
jgi:hypothetical protein